MTIRLLGMSDEERLQWEQATGIKTEAAVRIIEESIQETETLISQAIREVQEVVGPHGSVTRLQAGGVRVTRNGMGVYEDGVLKTIIESDGDFFAGSDTTLPETTTFCVFVNDQTYNNEDMGAGDLLIGDNTSGEPNVKYNAEEGRIEFRLGTTVNIFMDTEGALTISNNVTGISFSAVDPTETMFIKATNSDDFWFVNTVASGAIIWNIELTDLSTKNLSWMEDPANANVAQFDVGVGTVGTKLSIGGEVEIWAKKTGTTTVFNETGADIDFRIESDTDANNFFSDAGNNRIGIGTAAPVAGLDNAKSFALSGDITPSGLADHQNNYDPTGLSTASVIRLSAGSDYNITGLAGGADGRIMVLLNVDTGTDTITLKDEDSASDAANRFQLFSDIALKPGDGIAIIYDATSSRWRALAPFRSDSYINSLIAAATSDEIIQDKVGAMFSGNTETGVTVTYQDSDGTIDVETTAAVNTNSNDLFRISSCAASLFTGTINGTPSGTSVVYTPVSGNENVLVPASTSQLGKMRLYNTTRGNHALVSNCNTGTNTITLTATVPASWANGDALTTQSPTVSGGGVSWMDIEVTSGDFVGKSFVFLFMMFQDTGGAGFGINIHPFETFAVSKYVFANTQSTQFIGIIIPFKLTSNVISLSWTASGAATATPILRQLAYLY